MTPQEALKVLENEKECIQRQVNGNCDNKRDCANCDLRLEDKEIILAYNTAISALEKQIPKKVELYKHNGDFKWSNYPCPCCGEMLGLKVNKRYVKFCPNCGQALDWSDTE